MLADDHPMFRQSVRSVLDQEQDLTVIGEASDGEEAVRLASELLPDVILMDITMPKLDGLEATRQIKAAHPNIVVLVLTIHSDDEHVLGILEAGAAGYLTKSVFGEEIVQAVRGVIAGEMVTFFPNRPAPHQTGGPLSYKSNCFGSRGKTVASGTRNHKARSSRLEQ